MSGVDGAWRDLLCLRFSIIDVSLRECESPTCTSHGKRIAEVERVRTHDGSWVPLQDWLQPWIIHLESDPLLGQRIGGTCAVGPPK